MELFNGTVSGTGAPKPIQNPKGLPFIGVQQSTTDAATSTVIQGRMTDRHTWQDLVTLVGPSSDTVAWFHSMQAVVTIPTTAQTYVDLAGN